MSKKTLMITVKNSNNHNIWYRSQLHTIWDRFISFQIGTFWAIIWEKGKTIILCPQKTCNSNPKMMMVNVAFMYHITGTKGTSMQYNPCWNRVFMTKFLENLSWNTSNCLNAKTNTEETQAEITCSIGSLVLCLKSSDGWHSNERLAISMFVIWAFQAGEFVFDNPKLWTNSCSISN